MNRCVIAALALMVAGGGGCRRPAAEARSAPATAVSTPAPVPQAVPHGDHNPHHGGIVMMKDDLHYELVVDPAGHVRLFFTDAVREDLPASIASAANVTLRRQGGPDENIPLQIDGAGESWTGSGRPVPDLAQTTASVSFTIRGEPYSIDLPLAVAPAR
jgi:hypothetical protein